MEQFLRFLPVLIGVGGFIGLGLFFIWMDKIEKRKMTETRRNERMSQIELEAELTSLNDLKSSMQKERVPECEHDWQFDGQTMTSVRWTCTKCHKTKLNGLEV